MTRLYGRGPRGARVYDHVPNGRWETTTMIAAIGRNGAQAPWVLDGPMDGAAFAAWAEHVLAPTLEPQDIVAMDNLSVHKNAAARTAIKAAGAEIWDLPPYSPDLNPIEQFFAKLKYWMRQAAQRNVENVHNAIANVLDAVTPTECRNYVENAGYKST